MSFQWQDRDAAAGTLGVDTHTLQTWIDDGRAPSRTYQGKVQVLIELLDDEPETANTDNDKSFSRRATHDADADTSSTGQSAQDKSAGDPAASTKGNAQPDVHEEPSEQAQRVYTQAAPTDLELVSKRELQLAGGMVAAWQRLAETSNQDLARARKVGMLSWSLVASLVVISGIGLWFSTRSVTDAQGRLESTQSKLKEVEQVADRQSKKAEDLQAEVSQRSQELAEANAKLAASIERSNLTKTQADTLVSQHMLTKQLADKQIETARSLAQALQTTIDEQKARIAELDADMKAAQQQSEMLKTKLTQSDKQMEDQKASLAQLTTQLATQRDEAQKKIEALTADHTTATTLIDDLKKQVSSMKSELDDLKRAKETTSTAEKPNP